MPSSMPTEMRFFANFFYRNYPSPFARHWQPTNMLLSFSSPRWRTTWPRFKAPNHEFIRFKKKMAPKLQPYSLNYWRSAKCCSRNPDQRTRNDLHPDPPSRTFVGTTSASVLMQRSAASLASFARNRQTHRYRWTQPTRLAALNFSVFLIRTPNCISWLTLVLK